MKQQRKGRTTNAHLDMMISSVKFIKTHETTKKRKDYKCSPGYDDLQCKIY
jgi:hypothetical protein